MPDIPIHKQMFTIRREQFAVLDEHLIAPFEARVRKHVAAAFPELWTPMGELAAQRCVSEAVACARRWGMHSELDVVRFVDLAFALGPLFDHEPRFRAILESQVSAAARIDALLARVRNDMES